jgi:hypothetical protein
MTDTSKDDRILIQRRRNVANPIPEAELVQYGLTVEEAEKLMTSFTINGRRYFQFNV